MQVVDELHHAGTDKRVQGLVACIGRHLQSEGLAELQELRNAVHDFRLHAGYYSSWLLHLHIHVQTAQLSKYIKKLLAQGLLHASSAVVS